MSTAIPLESLSERQKRVVRKIFHRIEDSTVRVHRTFCSFIYNPLWSKTQVKVTLDLNGGVLSYEPYISMKGDK